MTDRRDIVPPESFAAGDGSDLAGILVRARATSARIREDVPPNDISAALDALFDTLALHMIPSDISALRKVLGEITSRLENPPDFG